MSATSALWYAWRGNMGLSKHGDPVVLHSCPLNQNQARVRTGGGVLPDLHNLVLERKLFARSVCPSNGGEKYETVHGVRRLYTASMGVRREARAPDHFRKTTVRSVFCPLQSLLATSAQEEDGME